MRASAIQHLAIIDKSAIVAAAFFEKTVQIWSWKTRKQLGEFETKLDAGGQRFALTPDGRICIAASYRRRLAAYSVPDGQLLWMRKDIGQVQYVSLSDTGREIYCGFEASPLLIIETGSGETIEKIRGSKRMITSQVYDHELIVRKDKYIVRGVNRLEIPAISFALVSAVFSPETVCIDESGTGIRCIDLSTGVQLWHHKSLCANSLTFNHLDGRFYCVGAMDTALHDPCLIRLASTLLECDRVAEIGQDWSAVFSPSGKTLITTEGEVYETSTGNLLSLLDFPQRDYPDA